MIRQFALLLFAAIMPVSMAAQSVDGSWLQDEVDAARAEHELIALGAAVARVGEDPVLAVSGETCKGSGEPARIGYAWHIGSNTKALTALLYARLVEDGLAEWGATLPELFPELADEMHPAWQDITIEDLFAHRSGLGQLGPVWLIARRSDSADLPDQRYETTRNRLTSAPRGKPGTFEYSNVNYIAAGAAIERLLEMSWEEAMEAYVFTPGSADWSAGWGTGAPQDGLQGHSKNLFGWRTPAGRGAGADNPAALGPAGTLHAPLESHARLLLEFLDEESRLITPGMRQHLLEPWPDGSAGYAMGWAVVDDETLGRTYTHNGSNTMWLSSVELIPELDAVIIVNTTEYTSASRAAVRGLVDTIEQELAAGG